jgi:hypothetical protein
MFEVEARSGQGVHEAFAWLADRLKGVVEEKTDTEKNVFKEK